MRQHLDMIRRVGGGLLCVAAVATFCAIAAALPTKDVASTGDLFMVEEIACARRGDSFIPGTIQRGVFTSITHEMRALRRQMSSLVSSIEVSRQDLRREYRTLSARRALERTICESNANSHPDRVLKKKLSLSSKAFRNNATIPDLNSCWGGSSKLVGSGTSPDIAWANVPSNAARLALLVTDSETNVIQWFILLDKKSRWFAKGLPANVPAAAPKQIKGTFQSKNDFGISGYSGPCPPDGATRRYLFELLALTAGAKGTAFGTTPSAIRLKLKKNTIASATYSGVFTGKETQPALPTPEPTATPAPVPPGAPGGLTGTRGNSQVALSWSAPSSNGGSAITDYIIEHSTNSGASWTRFTDATSPATSATVTGLTNGTAYIFRVAAVNSAGTGGFSANSSSLTPATKPSAPTGVSGTAGNTQVSLSWAAPTSNGGLPVTDYVLQRSADGGSNWTTVSDGVSTSTSVTITSLTNGIPYLFRVAAVNVIGTGSFSAASSALTPLGPPPPPSGVTGTLGDTQVFLAWNPPESDGGSELTDYDVQYSTDGGASWIDFDNGTSAAASVTVTGLANGTAYIFRVAATNGFGTSAFSDPSDSVTPAVPPDAPTGVSGTSGDTQVSLTWTAPASDGGSAVTDYTIQYSSDGGTSWSDFSDETSSVTSAIVTGLVNTTAYVFRVAAVNAAGTSAFSESSSSITPTGPPHAPTGLSGTAGNGQVSLTWTAPVSNGGSALTDYEVQFSSDGGINWSTFTDGTSTATAATVTGLANGTQYLFRVAGINAVGTGTFSDPSDGVTPVTTPEPPTGVSGIAGNTEVVLSWSEPSTDGGTSITDYTVQYSSNSGGSWTTFADGTNASTGATVTGLSNGTEYVFRVAAVNAVGSGSYSAASEGVTPVTTPDAPISLTGSAGDAQVSLSWTAPASNGGSAVTDYEVEYSLDGGSSWSPFADGTSTTTSATVTGLTNGTSYVFRVAAVNVAGTGSFSSNSATLTPATTPDAPTGLSGTAGNTQVELTWSAPAIDGGSAITDYVVQYSADSGTLWNTFSDGTGTLTSATVTSLVNGTPYVFRVAAVNLVGTGSFSDASSSITPITTPGAPTSLSGTAGDSQVSLSWTAPSSDGGSAITDYVVEYSSDSGTSWVPFSDDYSGVTGATVSGLSNGTAYIFRVAAVNEAGTGSYSTSSASVTPLTVPDAPTSLMGSAGDTQVALTWSAPTSDGGSAITDYVVELSADSGTNWSPFSDGTSTATGATVTGLTNGTAYIFRVAAINEAGTGAYSTDSGPLTPATTPDAPTSVSGTAGNTEVSLTWSAPAIDGGSAITDYEVEYSSDSGTTWTPFADGTSTATSATVTGLSNGTAYIFKVAAVNAVGTGSFSSNSGSVTPANTPDAPTSVSGTAGNSEVSLTWSAPASDGGNAITDYEIEYSSDSGGTWTPFSDGTSTSTSATVTGLSNGTAYIFRVAAVNEVGTSSFSTESSSVTPANTPDAPTGVSGTAGNTEVSLTWSAPAIDGGSAITDYEVEYSSDSGTTWTPFADGTSTTTSTTVTGLSNGTAYIFRVAAVNAVGTGSFSTESSSVTPANTPDAPTSVTGTAGNAEVSLTWTAPAGDGGSAITDYEVEYSSDSGTTWTPFADGTSTSTSATVTGLSNGTAYIFKVAAVNEVGTGSFSSNSGSVTPANTPDAPTGVSGTAGNAEVSLTWSAPAGDGGSAITDYEVEYSPDSGTTWTPFADGTSTTTSATVTGLSNGTAYIFKVAAVNEVETGSFSSNSGSVTPATTPDAPTNLSGFWAHSLQIDISWAAPLNDGGSAITDYEVEESINGGLWSPVPGDAVSTYTSYSHQSPNSSFVYSFRVRAVNAVGPGPYEEVFVGDYGG